MAKMLLIDDEPEIVLVTRKLLEREGYNVILAKDGREGLKIVENDPPDLILLDIMMPGEHGWKICRKIKSDEKTKKIPIAMFTVRVSQQSVQKSIEYASADAQINKPFETEELLKVVNNLLKN